jgi:hypothetical protein
MSVQLELRQILLMPSNIQLLSFLFAQQFDLIGTIGPGSAVLQSTRARAHNPAYATHFAIEPVPLLTYTYPAYWCMRRRLAIPHL